ncbi:MAG: formylglycine-generating enzyme family protein, partial [Deltaproteobacteria bacterium]
KGSYTGSASPYGTFDQGGNIWEFTDGTLPFGQPYEDPRVLRGGSFGGFPGALSVSYRGITQAYDDNNSTMGFRLAMNPAPEPGTGLLVVAGLLGLAGWRRGRD